MNDEIKEILKNIKKVANREIASRNTLMEMKDTDYQLLLDYITNLQQENEKLKIQNELLKDQNINEILKKDLEICAKQYKKSDEKLEKYKSRIEKAIEYLEQHKFNKFGDIDCGEAEEIIDILNGKE